MQKPSIGRVVIVPMNANENNGATEAPAVITRVWGDDMVNLRVLADSSEAPEWRTSVRLHETRPESPRHDAWWPSRV